MTLCHHLDKPGSSGRCLTRPLKLDSVGGVAYTYKDAMPGHSLKGSPRRYRVSSKIPSGRLMLTDCGTLLCRRHESNIRALLRMFLQRHERWWREGRDGQSFVRNSVVSPEATPRDFPPITRQRFQRRWKYRLLDGPAG